MTYLDENSQRREIECNTTLENFRFDKETEKESDTAEGETYQDWFKQALELNPSSEKFYLSKRPEKRCRVLYLENAAGANVVKEEGSFVFFYCS